jgi:hypothetical protein
MELKHPMGSEYCFTVRPDVFPVTPTRVPPGFLMLLKDILLLDRENRE